MLCQAVIGLSQGHVSMDLYSLVGFLGSKIHTKLLNLSKQISLCGLGKYNLHRRGFRKLTLASGMIL